MFKITVVNPDGTSKEIKVPVVLKDNDIIKKIDNKWYIIRGSQK